MGCRQSLSMPTQSHFTMNGGEMSSLRGMSTIHKQQTMREGYQKAISQVYHRPNNKQVTSIQTFKPATSKEDISKYYVISEKIFGQGKFGVVRRAKLTTNPLKNYAIKSIKKGDIKEDVLYLRREIEIFETLDHPNIVNFYEVYQDKDHFHFVVEFCEGGSLMSKLVNELCFTEADTRRIIYQILVAVNYLHGRSVCHRDIKPDNTLLENTHQGSPIKLTDFGLSKLDQGYMNMTSTVGTPSYVAPEVISKKYDSLCDIWSIGIMTYQLLTGRLPFKGKNNTAIFDAILNEEPEYAEKAWVIVSPEARDLVKRILVKDPSHRLNAYRCLEHQWFKQTIQEIRTNAKFYLSKQSAKRFVEYKTVGFLEFEFLKSMVAMYDSREDIKRLKRVFNYLDEEHDGYLNPLQLQTFIEEAMEVDLNDKELYRIMESLNLNIPDKISFTEFLVIGADKSILRKDKYLRNIFYKFDCDRDGIISTHDLVESYARFGVEIDPKLAKEILANFSDDKATYKHFKDAIAAIIGIV
jgi:calcium-dependent protein kinase